MLTCRRDLGAVVLGCPGWSVLLLTVMWPARGPRMIAGVARSGSPLRRDRI
jgi:hypothetical protein